LAIFQNESVHYHPPLNPLPSREGKERERFQSREQKKKRDCNKWRAKKEKLTSREGIYPLESLKSHVLLSFVAVQHYTHIIYC